MSSAKSTSQGPKKLKEDADSFISLNKLNLFLQLISKNEKFDPDVLLLIQNISEDFIKRVMEESCQLANLKNDKKLDAKDIRVILNQYYDIHLPPNQNTVHQQISKSVTQTQPHSSSSSLTTNSSLPSSSMATTTMGSSSTPSVAATSTPASKQTESHSKKVSHARQQHHNTTKTPSSTMTNTSLSNASSPSTVASNFTTAAATSASPMASSSTSPPFTTPTNISHHQHPVATKMPLMASNGVSSSSATSTSTSSPSQPLPLPLSKHQHHPS